MAGTRLRLSDDALMLVESLHRSLCKEKMQKGISISVDRVYDRMVRYLGLPNSSIVKVIKKKAKTGGSSKSTVKFKPRGRRAALDSFDRNRIQRTVHRLYENKVAPTVNKIKSELSDTLNISRTTLSLTLLDLGFTYRKRGENRKLFNNSASITNDRINYLRQIKQYRECGYEIVYLDETWCNKNHSSDFMWLPIDDTHAPNIPSGKGRRLIILHAGTSKEGLIDGCDHVFVAKSKDGDYHNEMNAQVFMKWFEDQLLPTLKEPSVIVLDNASYHNTRCEETVAPIMNKRKQELQDWLTKMGVAFSPLETKPQLYEKIKQNKQIPVYKTDVVALSHGHFVLRTPVRHCELNPIELIWANVKSYVGRNNTTFKLSDVRNLVYEAFGHIDANV